MQQKNGFSTHGTQGFLPRYKRGYKAFSPWKLVIGHYLMHLRINVKPHPPQYRRCWALGKDLNFTMCPHGQGGEFELG